MITGIVPHVGGPIAKGEPTVSKLAFPSGRIPHPCRFLARIPQLLGVRADNGGVVLARGDFLGFVN
jgi:hypothetical protein